MQHTREQRPALGLWLGLLSLGLAGCQQKDTETTKTVPLILIVVDTLRADQILDPEDSVATPNIDALAKDGVAFSQAFSHAPMTIPAHTSLFSSQSPVQTGVRINGQDVPTHLPLVAEYLRDAAGYQTLATVSMWTLGSPQRLFGIERGFDQYDCEFFGLLPPAPETEKRLFPMLEGLSNEQPFFMFAHYSDPHLPYNPHDPKDRRWAELLVDGELHSRFTIAPMTTWEGQLELSPGEHRIELLADYPFAPKMFELDGKVSITPDLAKSKFGSTTQNFLHLVSKAVVSKTDGADANDPAADGLVTCGLKLWIHDEPTRAEKKLRYPGEVEFADQYVGRLIAELKARDLYEKSLIIFTSDHGEALGEHDWWGHNENLYDELLHIPLIIKPPLGHPSAEGLRGESNSLVRHIDLVPTALSIMKLDPLPGQTGRVLGSGFDQTQEPPPLLAATRQPIAKQDVVSLRSSEFKLVYYRKDQRFELLDLKRDPLELTDLIRSDDHGLDSEQLGAWKNMLLKHANSLTEIVIRDPEEIEDSLRNLGYSDSEREQEREQEDS